MSWEHVDNLSTGHAEAYFNLSTFQDGYVTAVVASRGIDVVLPGGMAVYSTTITLPDEAEMHAALMDVYGKRPEEFISSGDPNDLKRAVAAACLQKGFTDEPQGLFLVQTRPDGPVEADRIMADLHDSQFSLDKYVLENFVEANSPQLA